MIFNRSDRIMVLGSCFAAGMGERLAAKGYDVCINPFGTLFNPVSIRRSIDRLADPQPFTESDCIQMGAGSDLWCSFSYYTKFARPTKEEFLANANAALEQAADFFHHATHLIITFGTAYCFRHKERDTIVSNCLKRPAAEFERFRLTVDQIAELFSGVPALEDKHIIFTVSPIRHLADGADGNQLSKATLLLATEKIIAAHNDGQGPNSVLSQPPRWAYFPAYEIMLDELRDYRWYAGDGVHPSDIAAEIIFDRFEKDFRFNQ